MVVPNMFRRRFNKSVKLSHFTGVRRFVGNDVEAMEG